jgi:hypothetical protein
MSAYWVWMKCRDCDEEFGAEYFPCGSMDCYDIGDCCESCGSKNWIGLSSPFEMEESIRIISERVEI